MAVIGLFSHFFRLCLRILYGINYFGMVCATVLTICVSKQNIYFV